MMRNGYITKKEKKVKYVAHSYAEAFGYHSCAKYFVPNSFGEKSAEIQS